VAGRTRSLTLVVGTHLGTPGARMVLVWTHRRGCTSRVRVAQPRLLGTNTHSVGTTPQKCMPIQRPTRRTSSGRTSPRRSDYLSAENDLTRAHEGGDLGQIDAAGQKVIRGARTASIELHQFSDVVFKEPGSASAAFPSLANVRSAVRARCTFLRSATSIDDVSLVPDVADAFKHHKPGPQEHWRKARALVNSSERL
jgi:hypothetical protein